MFSRPTHGSGRARHRHHGFGRAHGLGQQGPGVAFGPGGPFGPFGHRRRARRGDIRTAALLLLAEEPRNGYQIMQELEERSGGAWRPSPGSVYPALAQLEDEGLIRTQQSDGRKAFALTDAGREWIAQRGSDSPAPWEQLGGDFRDEARALAQLAREVTSAFAQVMRTGSPAQMAAASEVLAECRRGLYQILAEGEPAAPGESGEGETV
jgi:DNA-binding PadR family transcriptional regulator